MPRAHRGSGVLRAVLLSLALVATGLSMAGSPAAGAPVRPATVSTFNIVNYSTGKCIGIETTHNYAGDWTCTTNPDQTWHWGGLSADGTFAQLINGNGKCLALAGGSDAQGTRLIAFTCLGTGSTDQYWGFASNSYVPNTAYLMNDRAFIDLAPAKVAGVSGGSGANGAAIVLWTPLPHVDQFWCMNAPCPPN